MNKTVYNRLLTGSLYALVLLMALTFKYHYSRSGSDDLLWVLGPTAGLVEVLSRLPFEKEAGTGYVNQTHHVVIAPPCAGINFLIIALCMTAFSGIYHLRAPALRILWPGISLTLAYLLTLSVNTIRIIFSIHISSEHLSPGWGTSEMVHRVVGIVIYFSGLMLFHCLLGKMVNRINGRIGDKEAAFKPEPALSKTGHTHFMPVIWYCGLTIGFPLLNSAYEKAGLQFVEHAVSVVTLCLLVFTLFSLIRLSCKGRANKIK